MQNWHPPSFPQLRSLLSFQRARPRGATGMQHSCCEGRVSIVFVHGGGPPRATFQLQPQMIPAPLVLAVLYHRSRLLEQVDRRCYQLNICSPQAPDSPDRAGTDQPRDGLREKPGPPGASSSARPRRLGASPAEEGVSSRVCRLDRRWLQVREAAALCEAWLQRLRPPQAWAGSRLGSRQLQAAGSGPARSKPGAAKAGTVLPSDLAVLFVWGSLFPVEEQLESSAPGLSGGRKRGRGQLGGPGLLLSAAASPGRQLRRQRPWL
ncbi:PREDICTED: uncharacterized protein LOC109312589 [Crocodylus porosus]|uniref:uncharacterized protein LOC109312589 n=1 Tax=Crocodylus porosus TaxID=8502 RepID=UPI00093E4F98|nr:PREDICTED: uncharacterized protein LOC109312589 [Crocodylus porosus]